MQNPVQPEHHVLETPDYFRVSRRAYLDPAVLSREMKQIFERCWLYLGHESEVAKSGDYVVRSVGGHNLIFLRGQDSEVRALFNVCPHRGATVCRESRGNTRHFTCMYHAWTFDTTGKTVGRPESGRYGPGVFNGVMSDLMPVPLVDSHRGFYFINYDANADSLKSYLAGATEFLDRLADKSEVGVEIVGAGHQYGVSANWKGLAENFLDFYHVVPLHSTYFDYLASAGDGSPQPPGDPLPPHRSLGNGHAVSENRRAGWGRPVARAAPSWGESGAKEVAELVVRLERRFGKEYTATLANNDFNLQIFPNLTVSDNFAVNIRTYEPSGVGKVLVNSWMVAPKDDSEAMRAFHMKNFLSFLGPGGLASQDDAEALEHCQRGYENLPDGWNDVSRGMAETERITSDEENQRSFWREWQLRLLAD